MPRRPHVCRRNEAVRVWWRRASRSSILTCVHTVILAVASAIVAVVAAPLVMGTS